MAIEKSEHHDLVVGDGGGLTSFFMPTEIDRAFRENEFSVAELIEILTDIARATDTRVVTKRDGTTIEEPVVSPKERMAALQMLDKKAKEAMILGGLIQKERLQLTKTTEDGTTAEYNAEGMRLTREGSSRLKSTLALLEGASHSQSDEVIEVEVLNERSNDAGDGSPEQRGRVSGGKCNGPNPGDKPGRVCGAGGPGRPSSGGDGVCDAGHGEERTDPPATQSVRGEDDDKGTVGGAENERAAGVSEQHRGSEQGEGTGGKDRPDPERPKRPIIPGEHAASRRRWWDAGTPRREPDSDPGSIRDVRTAESQLDRLRRIEAARKHAADAAASYVKQREDNQRTGRVEPGDGAGTGCGE